MSGAAGARSADAHPPRQPQPLPARPHHPPPAYPAASSETPRQSASPIPGQSREQESEKDTETERQRPEPETAEQRSYDLGPAVRLPPTGVGMVPRTRQARLRVAKVDPWSVMKVGFLLSIALGVCTVVAVSVLWMVMDAIGVFSTVGGTVSDATKTDDSSGFDLESFLSLSRVLTFTSIIAVIDVVLATALATLGAFIYNFSALFVGGVEVTLAEDE